MLFLQPILLICHAWLVIAQEPPQRLKIPGVGFSLTPDYGIAAIYYKNGTWAEVARVDGSSTYKAMMRKAPSTELIPDQLASRSFMTEVVCPVLDTFKPELCKRNPDVESAKDLLRTLKAAVASHLGTTFCYAQIALPDLEWTYQKSVANLALHSIRLRPILEAVNEAPMAFWASHLAATGRPESESTRSILVIDYSESGLSASLLAEDEGIVDTMRRNRDESLGARNRAQPDHQKQVRAFLEKITKRPFGNDHFGQPIREDLGKIVLHGDATKDTGFVETLRSVVGSEPSDAHKLDPVFAVAVGSAIVGYDRMDDWQFVVKPALGCTWLSDLYTDRGELYFKSFPSCLE